MKPATRECENCGAEIGAEVSLCPYCGAENTLLARREEAAHLRGRRLRRDETYDEIERRETVAEHGKRHLTFVLLIAFAALLVLTVLFFFVRYLKTKQAPGAAEDRAKQLEAMYQAGAYEHLYESLQEAGDLYDSRYQKYDRVARMWKDVSSAVQDMNSYFPVSKYMEDSFYNRIYRKMFDPLQQLKQWEADGYLFGEEAAAETFEHTLRETIREKALLTDAEIDMGIEIAAGGEEDYGILIGLSRGRTKP